MLSTVLVLDSIECVRVDTLSEDQTVSIRCAGNSSVKIKMVQVYFSVMLITTFKNTGVLRKYVDLERKLERCQTLALMKQIDTNRSS